MACLALSFAPAATGQSAALPIQLAGTFEYPHGEAHAQAIIRAAVEPRIQQLPGMFQGIARQRMQERMRVARQLTIALGRETSVTFVGERTTAVRSSVPGTTTVTNPEGREVEVTQRVSGGWLEQTFSGENGQLRQLLSTEPDGATLHLDITLSSERLGEPIRYRLDYVRRATPAAE